ncbi:VCBS repeat-containing protein [Streptomyces sp. CAU 1734]|uniref:FG-GAP repeat domain-containing protein n=1 Tax=Streptomyces sp. CAU 1734 TaxID=3140360 RepID=UPI0032601E1A
MARLHLLRRRTRGGLLPLAVCGALLLTGCSAAAGEDGGSGGAEPGGPGPASALPVPRGDGGELPDDFNGDGLRDLVLNDLVKDPRDSHGDDAGIGIVYGTAGPRALNPAVNRLLTARANAAEVGGVIPAAFDARVSCDLDRDGFADLVVTTDPPYGGKGRPPVPLQLLFGSPAGLAGKAVVLRIPEKARYGNDWPDHPVCGDFDGDGDADLAVTASDGRIGFLGGPFTREGAPRTAATVVEGGGPALSAPFRKPDQDGDGHDDLVVTDRPPVPGAAVKGTLLRGGPDGPAGKGTPYRAKALPLPAAGDVLRYADFDGDKRPDVVLRTHQGDRTDTVSLYGADGSPLVTFSTALFLP